MASLTTWSCVRELPDGQIVHCRFLVKVSYIRCSLIISLTVQTATPTTLITVTAEPPPPRTITEFVTITPGYSRTVHQIIPDLYSLLTIAPLNDKVADLGFSLVQVLERLRVVESQS
jgi:hypothetical protein